MFVYFRTYVLIYVHTYINIYMYKHLYNAVSLSSKFNMPQSKRKRHVLIMCVIRPTLEYACNMTQSGV